MYKPLVTGMTALALVLSFATNVSANPKNKFGNYNTAKAKSTAIATADGGDANGNGGAAINLKNYRGQQRAVADGFGGYAGRGGTAKAYSESFNHDVEVISYQEMKATVWGAPIHVYGSVAYGGNADGGYGGDANANGGRGGNADATGGVLRTGDVRQSVALTGSFGGMANLTANTGINSANLGGISVAAHVGSVNVGR